MTSKGFSHQDVLSSLAESLKSWYSVSRNLLLVMTNSLVTSNLNPKPSASGFVERWPPKPRAMCWTPVKIVTPWASTSTLFNAHGDTNAIVRDSKNSRAWGRGEPFPSSLGASWMGASVSAVMTWPSSCEMDLTFPSYLNTEVINNMEADDDFGIKCVAYEWSLSASFQQPIETAASDPYEPRKVSPAFL